MSKVFVFILLTMPYWASAQHLKVVKTKDDITHCQEIFHVLAKDRAIRHGPYEKTERRGQLVETGYYKNGLKDSVWKVYPVFGDFIASQGTYQDDKKTGVWTMKKKEDTIEFKYDYSNHKLLYFLHDTSKKNIVLTGNESTEVILDQPPLYMDGTIAISNMIFENITYPVEARENNKEGRLKVGITIYQDGHAGTPWIVESVEKSIDEEGLRLANKIKGEWLPGILDGKAVNSVFILPLTFKLE